MLDAAHAERTSAEAVKKAIATAESALDAREAKLKEAWRLLHSQVAGTMQGLQVQVGAPAALTAQVASLAERTACWCMALAVCMQHEYGT